MNQNWQHIQTGKIGEDAAVQYLLNSDYEILNRNFRTRRGELDIVALSPTKELVFVEVKTAKHFNAGSPEAWVHKRKQQKILKMAEVYLYTTHRKELCMRFDVIGVELHPNHDYTIRHWKNAFIPSSNSMM